MEGQPDDFMAPFDLAGFVAASDRMQTDRDHRQHGVFNSAITTTSNDEPPMMSLQGSSSGPQGNMDAFQQLLAMQTMDSHHHLHHQPPPVASAQSLLEQQLRLNQLQQLQQLQNQIFQQQIELISGQTTVQNNVDGNASYREQAQFQGLPTPASSTEIRAQVHPNFVSPIILQNYAPAPMATPVSRFTSPNIQPGSSSAPAHIAFHNTTPLPSPAELDFDLSPLTSPWLAPFSQSDKPTPRPRANKRGASSSGDDAARKRQSPAIRPSNGTKRPTSMRGSASLTSTPALRSRSRKGSIAGDEPGDTPSPVDLSMPPPAPPTDSNHPNASAAASTTPKTTPPLQPSSRSTSSSPSMAPVTPASIMNLGPFGLASGLSSPMNTPANKTAPSVKSKIAPKPMDAPPNCSKPMKKSVSTSLVSPSLKPLLPGGLPASSAMQLAAHSNYSHHLAGNTTSLNLTPSTPLPQPPLQVRKVSHKAAEQKRRDSLKTSFDDLRLLLPPIPLPSDEGYDGEPPLPGAMPPRGPPRGDGGPNRAVSKLQLLRCGNDFIRQLKARVERRDEYIERLKEEVVMMRGLVGADGLDSTGMQLLDLDRDLDAIEIGAPRLGCSGNGQDDDYGDEDGGGE